MNTKLTLNLTATNILIALNALIFFAAILLGFTEFVRAFGFVARDFAPLSPSSYLMVLTSMFMHGGWLHIIFNMLYLYSFGTEMERELPAWQFLLLYFFSGIGGTLAQYLLDPASPVPLIGASGAISGLLGAFWVLRRGRPIRAFYISLQSGPGFGYVDSRSLLIQWLILQLFFALSSAGTGSALGGIAFMAHLGGFVTGMLLGHLSRNSDGL